MSVIATGSKTIIDLSDGKSLSVYLSSNMPRVQIYNVDSLSYNPSWTSQDFLLISPVIYANQLPLSLNIASPTLTIVWRRKDGNGAIEDVISGSNDESVYENTLRVTGNRLADMTSGLLTYFAYITYNDPDTGLPINAVAEISFALVKNGANAKTCKITGDQIFKYATDSANSTPTQITLSVTPVNCYFAKWKYKSGASWLDYPTTADNANISSPTLNVKPTHTTIWVDGSATIGSFTNDNSTVPKDVFSLFQVRDGATGPSGSVAASTPMAMLTNENITFAGDLDGKVNTIELYCNIVAYNGATKVTPTVGTIGAKPQGMSITKQTVSNNEVPLKIVIEDKATLGGAGQLQGTIAVPITTPILTTLYINWSKVNTGGTGLSGESASSADIMASSQVFKSVNGGASFSPTSIVMSPIFQGVSYSKWQYSINGGSTWVNIVSGTTPGCTIGTVNSVANCLTVANTSSLFGTTGAIQFKLVTDNASIIDTETIYRVQDGLSGMSAILSNEAHALPKPTGGDINFVGSGTTIRVFEGATELAYDGTGTANGSWKVIAKSKTGITGTVAFTDGGLFAKVTDYTAMTGDIGSVEFEITGKRASGVSFTLTKVQTLSLAEQGTKGINAIVFSLFTPNGNVFTNNTSPATLTIDSAAYDGSEVISTGASYIWSKYSSGSWTVISGQTAKNLDVNATDVVGTQPYQCEMTYGMKTYKDTITLIDKTDNYQSEILSTAGDVFKNTIGNTYLSCHIWQNGLEVDPEKSNFYGTPPAQTLGAFYYRKNAAATTSLMRWSGSAWVDVTTNATYKHSKTYNWYRNDKDGSPLNNLGVPVAVGEIFATGKVIFVDGDDVDSKTVFICEVL